MSETHQRFDDNGTPAHWRAAVRVDRGGKLAKAERTPSGGVRIEGSIARAGIYTYRRADGVTVRELLPPEEASRLESLRSLRDAPVTVGHPMGMTGGRMVTPDTYRADAVGHVSGEPRSDGKRVLADLAILDAEAIRRIDAGELVELSPGYALMIDPTPGVWNGERYDAVQRARVYNHVALLPAGAARGGAEASLRIDGVDDFAIELRADDNAPAPTTAPAPPTTTRIDTMKTERIDGIDYVVGSAEWQQAHARRMARLDEEKAALEEKVEKQDEDLDALKKERDELKAKLEEIEKKLGEAESPERMDARVAERTALLDTARGVLGADTKFLRQDGKSAMSDREVRVAVLAKLDPELKLDGKSDDVVQIHFDAATRFAAKGASATQQTAATSSSATPLGAARAAAVPSPGAAPAKRLDARDFTPDLSSKWKR